MMWSVWSATRFALGSYPRRSRHAREHAALIGERLLHSRHRIVGLDLVLKIDISGVPHCLELPEDFRNWNLSLPNDALTLRNLEVPQILGVHIQEARASIGNRVYDVGAGAHRVSHVDA